MSILTPITTTSLTRTLNVGWLRDEVIALAVEAPQYRLVAVALMLWPKRRCQWGPDVLDAIKACRDVPELQRMKKLLAIPDMQGQGRLAL